MIWEEEIQNWPNPRIGFKEIIFEWAKGDCDVFKERWILETLCSQCDSK